MIKSYLLVAYRNLVRYKIYSIINITGLAIGIAFCILTFLYVRNEWTYNTFHKNADQIYRVVTEFNGREGQTHQSATAPEPLGSVAIENIPNILNTVRFNRIEALVRSEKAVFSEHMQFADASLFEVFSFPLLQGEPQNVFRSPQSVIISNTFALKHFGTDSPIGKTLWINPGRWWPEQTFTVSGVLDKIPNNSTFRFDVLLPYKSMEKLLGRKVDWYNSENSLYVHLTPGSNLLETASLLSELNKTQNPLAKRRPVDLTLQPLKDIHLNPNIPAPEWETAHNPLYSYVLAGIASLVLLIASINFINLSMGQSHTRAREVGVRKVMGAKRKQVMTQFWSEFVLTGAIAMIFALAFAELALPFFNQFVQSELSLISAFDGMTIVALLGLITAVGIVAGGYPALVLSGLSPISVLQSRLKIGGRNLIGRTLVVFQFALSALLVVCTLIMTAQTHFMKHKDLNFSPDHIVMISTKHLEDGNNRFLNVYRQELASRPRILEVTSVDDAFERMDDNFVENKQGQRIEFGAYYIDYNLLNTLKLDLIAGRNFSDQFPSDAAKAVIVNEALVRAMGWDNPVGRILPFTSPSGRAKVAKPKLDSDFVNVRNPVIIGVVPDFHFKSLHHKIEPMIFKLDPSLTSGVTIFMKISSEEISETLTLLESTWKSFAPNTPFEWKFLNDHINARYAEEERWTQIVLFSSLFAIFIACLGAFGLTALAVSRRTKEIGIRKILGASIPNIISLLSKEFILLIAIANIIAWPVAYWAMNQWLSDFAYRINLGIGTFILGGLLTLIVVIGTVSLQAFKAAKMNPVDTLRYE